MQGIMVSSVEGDAGKSSMIIAMASYLLDKGYSVGYFKPLGTSPEYHDGKLVDGDALNTSKMIGVEDEIDDICPIVLNAPYAEFINIADPNELKKVVSASFDRIKEEKDFVFVEGSIDYKIGSAVELGDISVSKLLDLKALLIAGYSEDFVLDRILTAKSVFGERLKAVIFNKLTGYKRSYIEGVAGSLLQRNDLEILGIIPRDVIVGGVFIDEIKDYLKAEYLVEPREDMIVENIIVGAMSPNSAIEYFRRAKNAALVTGGDRADLQVVALEIPNIKLIILTGNLRPSKFILDRAESKGVPVLLVSEDTLTTTERLEKMFGKSRIKSEIKLKRMRELFESFVNLEAFERFLGI
ncbi:BioD-like N-terminal domain of phosphotransacetylase [Archaeoglobus sulfaticallidus PM70-1]|uniref:BioD-like N-terminal domain of phosphotransacetylase n=1 Tax=Archaeoglobus sulfaticallidus PM70-1 TaxID=387631 RepID=N0BIQ7_9EURY|nr:phosphotransacetylase family protein [Archaeoglobus sulfaticallidus]AGK62217.1 BioD-like N-terminal domain of phosphotransacetylase [Archaeoglobus sulfaticallidus PM70-1]